MVYNIKFIDTFGNVKAPIVRDDAASAYVPQNADGSYSCEAGVTYRTWWASQGAYTMGYYVNGTGSLVALGDYNNPSEFSVADLATIKASQSASAPSIRMNSASGSSPQYYFKIIPPPTVDVDLASLEDWGDVTTGSHTLKVKAKGTGYRDSELSSGVGFTKGGGSNVITYSVTWQPGDDWVAASVVFYDESDNLLGQINPEYNSTITGTLALNGTVKKIVCNSSLSCEVNVATLDGNALSFYPTDGYGSYGQGDPPIATVDISNGATLYIDAKWYD